jgi:hypothetical protein
MMARGRGKRLRPKFNLLGICVTLCVILMYRTYHTNKMKPALGVLVSYVYFESTSHNSCEVANKRTNLAFFIHEAVLTSPPGIHFIFRFTDKVPSASILSNSIGIPILSKTWELFARILAGENPNVQVLTIPATSVRAPDLCHHWFSFDTNPSKYDYFMLVNDGVRGPFTPEALTMVSSEPR